MYVTEIGQKMYPNHPIYANHHMITRYILSGVSLLQVFFFNKK